MATNKVLVLAADGIEELIKDADTAQIGAGITSAVTTTISTIVPATPGTAGKQIFIMASAGSNDVAGPGIGGQIQVLAGAGGNATGGGSGGFGGNLTLSGGLGGLGAGSSGSSGHGGGVNINSGNGGPAVGALINANNGGSINVLSGTGGAGNASRPAANGGQITINGGPAGSNGGAGGGTGGRIDITGGVGTGAAAGGLINIIAGANAGGSGGSLTLRSGNGATAGDVSLNIGTGTAAPINIGTTNAPSLIALGVSNTVIPISLLGTVDGSITGLTGEAIAAGVPVCVDVVTATPRIFRAQASAVGVRKNCIGIARFAQGGIGNPVTITKFGTAQTVTANWTPGLPTTADFGATVYLSDTVGLLTLTAPANKIAIGTLNGVGAGTATIAMDLTNGPAVITPGGSALASTMIEQTVDTSLTSTTFTSLLSGNLTTGANKVLINFTMGGICDTNNRSTYFRLLVDAAVKRGAAMHNSASNLPSSCAIAQLLPVTAGLHTFAIEWRVSGSGTSSIRPVTQAGIEHAALTVVEIL